MDKFTVRDASGAVDVEKSVEAFRSALNEQVAQAEKLATQVEGAVDAVFDEQGERLPKGMLIDFVLAKLGRTATNNAALTQAVENYLRTQTSKDKGADGRRIAALKGQKGGLLRLAKPGQPVTALKTESK